MAKNKQPNKTRANTMHERRATLPLTKQDFSPYFNSSEFKAKQRRSFWRVVMWLVLVIIAIVTACVGMGIMAVAPQPLAWVLISVGGGTGVLALGIWLSSPTVRKALVR